MPYQRAASSLAKFMTGCAVFATMPGWPDGHHEDLPQRIPVSVVFANAGKAVPYLFNGTHAPDLSHLGSPKAAPRGKPEKSVPPSPEDVADYMRELGTLKETCPSLASYPADKLDVARWFVNVTGKHDLSQMPRNFLESAYHTIGRITNSPFKTQALVALHKALPDSPEFIAYLDSKRDGLDLALEQDPRLQYTDEQWQALQGTEQQEILAHIMRQTLKTLLPENEIAFPRLLLATKNYPSEKGVGRYSSNFNDVYIDGKSKMITGNFAFAKKITIHESYHAFASILAQWFVDGKLGLNADLNRQGKLYQLATIAGGSAINVEDSDEGYRTSFGERGAWAFQLAASKTRSPSVATDMFVYRYDDDTVKTSWPAPAYHINSSQGKLPSACLPL